MGPGQFRPEQLKWRFFAILDSPKPSLYNPGAPLFVTRTGAKAQVAQLVEHVTENHGVGGSIPPLGTTPLFRA